MKKIDCPLCDDYACSRQDAFERHLSKAHDKHSITDVYVETQCAGVWPVCECGCKTRLPWRGWTKGFARFVVGHNANIYAIYDTVHADKIIEKRAEKLRGRVGWSRGLTKKNSPTIAARSEKIKRGWQRRIESGYEHPFKGMSKETDERIARAAETLRQQFVAGERTAWHRGLTKETDSRLEQMGISISRRLSEPGLKKRLTAQKRLDAEEIIKRLPENSDLRLLTDLSDYTRDRHVNLLFACARCGDKSYMSLIQAMSGKCRKCDPNCSSQHAEITRFVESIGVSVTVNDRSVISPREIDIYCATKRVGIEFNGLFFHSELYKSSTYHQEKTNACFEQGVRLIHIFEDEWRDKRPICESIIRHALGVTKRKIGARECAVVPIDRKSRQKFFDRSHLDGDVPASIAWALLHGDDHVAMLSLRKKSSGKYKGFHEVARFAPATDTHVAGGMSRLIKHAIDWCRQNESMGLMTYADTRFGDGTCYEKSSFVFDGNTISRFWWTDGHDRFDRFNVKADKKNGLTERQAAAERGVVRIYGCVNKRYVFDIM